MEASLPVQWRVGSQSRIQSSRPRRDGDIAAARRRRASRERRSVWHHLLWRQHAPAPAPAPAERVPRWGRPRLWRPSLKAVGSVLARVACICKPEVHGDIRSGGGRSPPVVAPAVSLPAGEWASWRSGSSRMWWDDGDDVLMRRLVLGDELRTRWRMEMQEAARWSGRNWFPPGPSRLSQMSLAATDGDEEEEDSYSSTSPQCSEAL